MTGIQPSLRSQPRRKRADRLFFALLPPAEARAAIAAVRDGLALRRPVADARLHLTLFLLPDQSDGLPATLVRRARAAGDAMMAAAVFAVALDEVVGRDNAVLRPSEPLAALASFQRGLARALADEGLGPHAAFRFAPHVTLGHGLAGSGDGIARAIHPVVTWPADAFVLLHSEVGLGRYTPVARWPLAPRRPAGDVRPPAGPP